MTKNNEEVLALLKNLSDDVSMDDIIDAIYVRQKILRGLQDSKNGNTHTQEEVEEIMEKWLK